MTNIIPVCDVFLCSFCQLEQKTKRLKPPRSLRDYCDGCINMRTKYDSLIESINKMRYRKGLHYLDPTKEDQLYHNICFSKNPIITNTDILLDIWNGPFRLDDEEH